jgi:asparagine synthase (glutamine-hydrolysing)
VCGICGKVYRDRARIVEAGDIIAMRDAMTTRGPDAGGIYLDRHAALGHRRLSVIDLEASAQPMPNESGTIWISYNGEIYNFRELRKDLIARGYRFRTSGDTEVIVHLYEEFGEDCVKQLRGMFAFAIWDSRSESLFLARDRMGVKPLYYALTGEEFLFGSELKALLAAPALHSSRVIDLSAVHSYLSFLSVPDPLSIYQGISKLPAAHTLTLRNGQISLRRYWDVTFTESRLASEQEWCEELLQQLREAVNIRLVADVPLGAFLSGGVDSSTVVALMAGLMNRPVKTFSIGFSENAYNEASDAKLVAQHLATDHTELILSPTDARPLIPRMLDYFDEPFADSSAIPTFFVSQLARQRVTVALSGDGGDELFGGYPWRQLRPSYQTVLSRAPAVIRRRVAALCRVLPAGLPASNFLRKLDIPYNRYILDAMAVFDEQDRHGLYSENTVHELAGADPYHHHLVNLQGGSGRSWAARMMEYDLKTYLPNDILTKVDRMSMMNSLEAREPLLDHHLVEFAASMPCTFKIRDGISKYILKKAMAPALPASVMAKRKQGFSVPLESWLRNHMKDEVLDTLRAGNQHGIFDRRGIDRLTDSFFKGDDRRNHQVWTLYVFEHWYQRVHARMSVLH